MDIRAFVPFMVLLAGGYFAARIGVCLIKTQKSLNAKAIRVTKNGFSTLTLAFAGTLGVGNIFGVATALIFGGVGSIFWLLVSAFFSGVIKYAEVSLTLSYGKRGGVIYAISKSFGMAGGALSSIYAACALMLGVVMGFALQGGSVCESVYVGFGIPRGIIAALLAAVSAFAVADGKEKIKGVTAAILPMTTIIYIIMTLYIVCLNVDRIPNVWCRIVSDAFNVKSTLGGVVGFFTLKCVKEGFCGGILSNEAGAGTSSFAHSTDGGVGAVGGVLEVLFDTVILCMLTAFSILVCVPEPSIFDSGIELVIHTVYYVFGGGGIGVLCFISAAFAVCTVVCWYYYCSECSRKLFKRDCGRLLIYIMSASIFLGAYAGTEYLVFLSHILLTVLSVISLSTLVKNSDRVLSYTLSERKPLTKGVFLNSRLHRARRASKEPRGYRIPSFLHLRK